MGYMHIDNAYKKPHFLQLFKTVYCLEKIDGTSCHIKLSPQEIRFFSGCIKQKQFEAIFDKDEIKRKYDELNNNCTYLIYGEGYGGKVQGMSKTYGVETKFCAFDVKFSKGENNGHWMNVPEAENFVKSFGFDFVYYEKVDNTLEEWNRIRDLPSQQAIKNGIGNDKISEGVVIRPIYECFDQWGDRYILKHKKDAWRETTKTREVDSSKLEVLTEANDIAMEWVTEMRLTHVLDKLNNPSDICKTKDVIVSMIEDVKRESSGEVVWSKNVEKAIGSFTAKLFKERLRNNYGI